MVVIWRFSPRCKVIPIAESRRFLLACKMRDHGLWNPVACVHTSTCNRSSLRFSLGEGELFTQAKIRNHGITDWRIVRINSISWRCLIFRLPYYCTIFLALYCSYKETFNQVSLSLAAVNKFNQERNWIILNMKYTSGLRLLVTLKSLFFNGLIAITGH